MEKITKVCLLWTIILDLSPSFILKFEVSFEVKEDTLRFHINPSISPQEFI